MLERLVSERIQFDVRLSSCQSSVLIDPSQLEQIVLNLVVNARDAMPDGGSLIIKSSDIVIDGDPLPFTPAPTAGRYVELSIQDSGSGIPEQALPHIFEPFFTTKEQGQGTGLGLSTVYGIVTQNKGSIGVATSVGAGTLMRIVLPFMAGEEMEAGPQDASPRPELTRFGTLLLVEDDASVRAFLGQGLRRVGYTVLEAGSGEEALRTVELRKDIVDVLVSDVIMPGMTGPRLAGLLVERNPAMSILLISGYDEVATDEIRSLNGKFQLITKPFTVFDLIAKVPPASSAGAPR